MRILLSYSKAHYDPAKSPSDHKFWNSSASILARSLYEILVGIGEVTYIDRTDFSPVIGWEFDLFIGIAENFDQILKKCRIRRSVFFAVNMHPRERNSLLKAALREWKVPKSAAAGWEFHDVLSIENGLAAADHILCVGNDATVQSYVKNGVPRGKIRRINYSTAQPAEVASARTGAGVRRFVYVASEIGLRKGFDSLAETVSEAMREKLDFTLDIIGRPSTDYYQRKLEVLLKKSEGRIKYHGWIDSTSEEYWDILREADFAVFPSVEEGQAGSVLDCISTGAIPLISSKSGVDYAPLGFFEGFRTPHNISIFENACETGSLIIDELKKDTLRYYRDYHGAFREALSSALADILNGRAMPKMSVVLPIFNKQNSIRELLVWLDACCLAYKNIELHIFFDGCKDATEPLVRKFFKNKKSYPVTFETTPNIFEVKTNNLGLKKATGEVVAIVQDDNYLYDKACFFQAADLFNINPKMAVLGGLAGVNYYPRGTEGLSGPGQIAANPNEVYWRQDVNTDPALAVRIFEVDACMRGPLFLRRRHAEALGYLDEIYAPLYQDDMDYCFRAKAAGYQVFCSLMQVENRSLTMANYDPERNNFFNRIMKRNTDIFYSRHKPDPMKSKFWIHNAYKTTHIGILSKIEIARLRSEVKIARLINRSINKARKVKKALSNA